MMRKRRATFCCSIGRFLTPHSTSQRGLEAFYVVAFFKASSFLSDRVRPFLVS